LDGLYKQVNVCQQQTGMYGQRFILTGNWKLGIGNGELAILLMTDRPRSSAMMVVLVG
jgi:hypothetical protein